MKKALPLILSVAVCAMFSACSSSDDDHGVQFQRGGWLSSLFGYAPVAPDSAGQPAAVEPTSYQPVTPQARS